MNNVVDLGDAAIRKQEAAGEVPDFIDRQSILKMTDPQLDTLLEGIRVRRLAAQVVYEQTMADKELANQEAAKEKIEKKADQIIRKIEAMNKQFTALEKYVNELQGLRVIAGLKVV